MLIGLKVALSKLMPGADFFVMDNPLLHMDEYRRNYLKGCISKMSKYKQIVLLTNDRGFADEFENSKRYNLL